MNVLENVLIGFNKQMKYNIFEAFLHLGRFGKIEQVFKEKAYAILEELGIAEFAYEKATSLSYGQQRKVEIARAMATQPRLLLLDEPAAGMNSSESDELAELIFKLRKDYKISVLLIEHDMKFVNKLCDRVLVLDYGKTIFEGKLCDAVNHKEVIAAYLGILMLIVKDLHVYYGLIEAVKGIDFKVETGHIVSLIGSNGAGKTSTLNALFKLS